jgi:hypothetical protein
MSPEFTYSELLPIGPDTTKYRSLGSEGVRTLKAVSYTHLTLPTKLL